METLQIRLDSFKTYKEGWMNGEGEVFSVIGLDWLYEKFEANYGKDLLLPATFPTLDGCVQFEWVKNHHDVSLNVNLTDRTGNLNYYSITREEVEFDYNLDEASEWMLLNNFLNKFFSKS